MKSKEKTWSPGTNLLLPFPVHLNVIVTEKHGILVAIHLLYSLFYKT